MVNISNLLCVLIELPIYCLMLVELILKVSVDKLYWNWLNYMLLLRNGELKINIDDVIVMWIDCWEMMNWSECERLDLVMWLICVWLLRNCDFGICWVEKWDIELCWW